MRDAACGTVVFSGRLKAISRANLWARHVLPWTSEVKSASH